MDCPNCNSQDIEIGESEITGTDFTAKVWYASCHATIGEDVNWGGGYDCEFFIVRESKEALLAEVQRRTLPVIEATCPKHGDPVVSLTHFACGCFTTRAA